MVDNSDKGEHLRALLARCAQQDQTAFQQLYDLTSKQIYATLLSILRVEAIAEEALQESYLKVWQNAANYQATLSQPLTWMTSIARYHALDVLRKRRLRENRETALDSNPLVDAILQQDGPHQSTELNDILAKCFKRLNDNQRLCIARAYLEGLTQDELSQSIKKPVGTVKSWIRRGLAILKECVNELS